MTYQEAKQQAELEAQVWMDTHKSELSDVPGDAETYGQKKGYEVPMMDGDIALADAVAEVERLRGELYEVTVEEDTAIEAGGIFNVVGILACWQGKTVTDAFGKRTKPNGGFIAEKYPAHQKKAAKKRARFGLEDFYLNNGRLRATLLNKEEEAKKIEVTINNYLDNLGF